MRTGAVPTLPPIGGGELALEIDVDVTEALSEYKSLFGVPGRFTEAMLACLDLSFSIADMWGTEGAEGVARGGGTSDLGVGMTRRVLGAVARFIGDPEVAVAGLEGTDVGAVSVRIFFAWISTLLGNGDCDKSGAVIAAVMSSLPGCCRFVGAGVETGLEVTSLTVSLTFPVLFVCGLASAVTLFFLVVGLTFWVSCNNPSGRFFLSCGCFGVDGSVTASLLFLAAPVVVCSLAAVDVVAVFVGVTGEGLAGVLDAVVTLVDCLSDFLCDGVAGRIGVTGTTGTAGMMVDEVVRDIGRDSARDADLSLTARGTAGTVNPGGMTGVALRGGSGTRPLIGLLAITGMESGSLSFTSASTLSDACSSALNGTSSVQCG